MPTYEYACENCGHEFEREQRITEDPIKKCPQCGEEKARRMIVGGNFILKGGGWESDLYSGPSNVKDKGAEPKKEASSSESTSSESSSKSESKSTPKESPSSSTPKKKSD